MTKAPETGSYYMKWLRLSLMKETLFYDSSVIRFSQQTDTCKENCFFFNHLLNCIHQEP